MVGHKIKILIGAPTYEGKKYIRESYFQRLSELTETEQFTVDYLFVDNSNDPNQRNANWIRKKGYTCCYLEPDEKIQETLAKSFELLRMRAVLHNYDYLFLLEADIIPPPNILLRLLSFKRELKQGPVSAWYEIGKGLKRIPALVGIRDKPSGEMAETFTLNKLQYELFLDGSCRRIHACGTGCILIPRFVLEKIKFRYDPEWPQCPDTWFFVDLHNKGIPVFVDTATKVEHYNQAWSLKKMFKGYEDKIGRVR